MSRQNNISVIVPAYNAEATILKCLEGLQAQTLRPREIMVVDDGSSDATVTLARTRARVVTNDRSKGAGGARNAGALAAHGEILAFTDSDCIPPPHWLERMVDPFDDERVGAVGGGYSSGVGVSFWQKFCAEELAFRRRHFDGPVSTLVSNNLACRRSVFFEIGGFPEQYPVTEDMLFSYRVSRKYKVLWLNENGVQHHFKDGLVAFLRHQYNFAAESTRTFLENPGVLVSGSHQGRALHIAIGLAFLVSISALAAAAVAILGHRDLFAIFGVLFLAFLLGHLLVYAGFLRHIRGVRRVAVGKAYGISLARDIVCTAALLGGISRTVRGFLVKTRQNTPSELHAERARSAGHEAETLPPGR